MVDDSERSCDNSSVHVIDQINQMNLITINYLVLVTFGFAVNKLHPNYKFLSMRRLYELLSGSEPRFLHTVEGTNG